MQRSLVPGCRLQCGHVPAVHTFQPPRLTINSRLYQPAFHLRAPLRTPLQAVRGAADPSDVPAGSGSTSISSDTVVPPTSVWQRIKNFFVGEYVGVHNSMCQFVRLLAGKQLGIAVYTHQYI